MNIWEYIAAQVRLKRCANERFNNRAQTNTKTRKKKNSRTLRGSLPNQRIHVRTLPSTMRQLAKATIYFS